MARKRVWDDTGRSKQQRWRAEHPEQNLATGRAYRERNKEKLSAANKVWRLQSRHGMTADDWQEMWDAQDGCCYLCGHPMDPEKVHIDHDHSCHPKGYSCVGCRRGLAHPVCNQLIGLAEDNPDRLRFMADNLDKAQLAQRLSPAWRPWLHVDPGEAGKAVLALLRVTP